MFSWAPFSIENSVLMLPWARTRNRRWRNETSFRSPVNRPRTAIAKSSLADALPDAAVLDEVAERPAVPFLGALRGPRRLERDLLGHPVDLGLRQRDRGDRERADLRDEPGVPADASTVDEQVRALDVRLVRRDADLGREREHRVVLRPEPRTTAVDGRAVGELLGPDPAADPVPGLEHDDGLARPGVSRRAAVSPAYPAPTTHTSASTRSGIGRNRTHSLPGRVAELAGEGGPDVGVVTGEEAVAPFGRDRLQPADRLDARLVRDADRLADGQLVVDVLLQVSGIEREHVAAATDRVVQVHDEALVAGSVAGGQHRGDARRDLRVAARDLPVDRGVVDVHPVDRRRSGSGCFADSA